MIQLEHTGTYRDGGTCDVDSDGNKYHRYQSMMKSIQKEGGKLYMGNLTRRSPGNRL